MTFPDLGAGLWVLSDNSTTNIDIGLLDIGASSTVNVWVVTSATFVSSKTPVRLSGGTSNNRTINYVFYSTGGWG